MSMVAVGSEFMLWYIYQLYSLNDLQDWEDVDFGISEGVDFIAMSFVNDADSVKDLKNYLFARSSK